MQFSVVIHRAGAYLRKIALVASTEIALCIYNVIIIMVSSDIHNYVYYMIFAKLLQENYLNNLF
jgi:predicted nucleotide-binding protein (sugar kinase/HSP70/actin superfamily)